MQSKWLIVAETAEYLKMGRSTVYKLLKDGKLPAHKAGKLAPHEERRQ
ncbi:MAG: helix-turn-helix domain-containing protein [Deltaproteobacteria bacterium]|nr:helix-turn-helix domain-containing protein [Deltaproteobacteria bacterium]